MAKYIPSRNYIGSSEIATDLDVTGPATFANSITLNSGGNDTYIEKTDVGDLYILNSGDDKDIILGSDDGSGNTTTYFALDGSAGYTQAYKKIRYRDSVKAEFGDAGDLDIYHDGSNSYISQGGTGDLYITQNVDDKDIIFQSDDGSGGVETYLFLDGSTGRTIFPDNKELRFGTGSDLNLYHDGSNSYIVNNTGSLQINQNVDDGDIIFKSDDGSGGTAAYLTLDGGSTRTNAHKEIRFDDDVAMRAGAGGDLRIKHDGTDSLVDNFTGNLYFRNYADDKDIIFQTDDGSGGTTSYITLDGSAAHIIFSQTSVVADDKAIMFGTGGDAFFKHTGSQFSFFNDTGPVIFYQRVDDGYIAFQSDDGSGGLTEYLRIDGQNGNVLFSKPITVGADGAGHDVKFFLNASGRYIMIDEDDNSLVFTDNANAKFGNGGDLQLMHDGTDSRIDNMVGHLKIRNYSDNSDIIFETDNGSGSTTTYLTLDGGFSTPQVRVPDNVTFSVGNSQDLRLEHDGSDSRITQGGTGNLIIRQTVDDADLILQCDDGSGGNTAYITLDGSETEIHLHKPVGIGTTNPDTAYKLDVAGKVQVQSVLELDDVLTLNAISTPADPAAGKSSIYMDSSDGAIKVKINVGGTVVTRTIASYE
jgi:hypothetical protein